MAENDLGRDDKNIARRSFKAVGGVLVFQFASQFVQVLLTVFLARLLLPEDYGIAALFSLFWGIGVVFINGGFAAALVQRRKITETDLNSVFCFNLAAGLFCCAAVSLLAPRIAHFYDRDVLEPVLKALAWTFPLNALVYVQNALAARRLKPFLTTLSVFAANVIAGCAAVFLALRGFGVWAIVWQRLLFCLFYAVAVSLFIRWVPKLRLSFRSLRRLFPYGSKLLAIDFMDAVTANFANMVIGKHYSSETLGLYSRADYYARLCPTSIQAAISGVLFPALSKFQDDVPRLRAALRRAMALAAFAVVPLPILVCALCKPLILLLLGEKWLLSLPYWWLVTMAVISLPVQRVNLQLFKAVGRSDICLLLEIIKKVFYAVGIAVLVFWGIIPMLICEIVFSLVCIYVFSYFTGRDFGYGMAGQLHDFLPYPALGAAAGVLAWGLYRIITPVSAWAGLILPAAAGGAAYLALNALFRTAAFREAVRLFKGQTRGKQ